MIMTLVNNNYYFQDGYVFRLRIHYPRELVLMKEEMAPAASSSSQPLHPEGPEASLGVWEGEGKERVRRVEEEEVMLPLHTSTINGYVRTYVLCVCVCVCVCVCWKVGRTELGRRVEGLFIMFSYLFSTHTHIHTHTHTHTHTRIHHPN